MDGTVFVNEAEVGPVSVDGITARFWNLVRVYQPAFHVASIIEADFLVSRVLQKCSCCPNDYDASFGACVPCDAGGCKNSLHITCAQKWGLLEDKSNEETEMANPYFVFCKNHGPNQPPRVFFLLPAPAAFNVLRPFHLKKIFLSRWAVCRWKNGMSG